MTDIVYIDGVEVAGAEFPSVYRYDATLRIPEPMFTEAFKILLDKSPIAVLEDDGACLMIDGATIKIHKLPSSIMSSKPSKKTTTELIK